MHTGDGIKHTLATVRHHTSLPTHIGKEIVQITLTPEGESNRYGSNQLTISAGFTIWY